MGRKNKDGYGVIDMVVPLSNRSRYAHRVHRISFELANGPIPNDVVVCHNCPDGDNPACVNPDHLFIGSQSDNVRDMYEKGRGNTGEKHGRSKLTESQVLSIREKYRLGVPIKKIKEEFNLSRCHFDQIVNKRRWTHLP